MTGIPVRLPGPVAVVPSPKALERLSQERSRGRREADPVQLAGELSRMAYNGGVPARVDDDRGTRRLALYTDRHVLWLYLTQFGDGYRLGQLAPLNFKDHERLTRGALLLQGAGWRVYQHVRDIPKGSSAHWDLLSRAWAGVGAEAARPRLPPHHEGYLNLVTGVVEASRDLEMAKANAHPAQYRNRASAREERHSARGAYTFHLLEPSRFTPGAPVRVDEDPQLRGRVVRSKGTEVVVRFDTAVDFSRFRPQGTLHLVPSQRVYQTQLDAIQLLRDGRSANPNLLAAFVDGHFAPFRPAHDVQPRRQLDKGGQRDAFDRALGEPDLLLVLGPPGTGKTWTIREIAAAYAARQRRILVTSHSHRAVDNVLEGLSSHLRCVRVGNEDLMTGHARGFMVEAQVDGLKEEIVQATEATAAQLAPFAQADGDVARWLAFLTAQIAAAQAAERDVQASQAALTVVAQRVTAPLQPRIVAAEAATASCRAAVERWERVTERRRTGHARAATGATSGWFRGFHRWLAGRRLRRLDTAEQELATAREALATADADHAAVDLEARSLIAQDPEGARLSAAEATARGVRDAALAEAGRGATAVRTHLRPVAFLPEENPPGLPEWEQYAAGLRREAEVFHQRAILLREWRDRVRTADQELQHELVRFADVVAATCIGAATTPLLAELDFDLAIVDEAGQISLPNLLVPLVRARRAVIVGDHHQLPPFLDDDADRWARTLSRRDDVPPQVAVEIGEMLRKSAFERLFDAVPTSHLVPLTLQRRMPEPLARFISQAFYGGTLGTEHPGRPPDPLFTSPLAFIDTADRPAAERAERDAGKYEEWGLPGVVNELEAALIVKLLIRYVRYYPDWAVIVPYRAQARKITELLTGHLGDAGKVTDNVGTVDSFQGSERDLIVYGFTRSNSAGKVGFLKELRRVNVAMTRTKQQLVLVGDTATLFHARDEGFAALMRGLAAHLRTDGDLRRSRQVEAKLNGLDLGDLGRGDLGRRGS